MLPTCCQITQWNCHANLYLPSCAAECPSLRAPAHAGHHHVEAAPATGKRAVLFTFPFCWFLRRVKDVQFFIHLLAVWVSSFVNYVMAKPASFIFFKENSFLVTKSPYACYRGSDSEGMCRRARAPSLC